MKPNAKQTRVGVLIKEQVNFWSYTNDISSPTHSCDIDEVVDNAVFYDEISEPEAEKLKTHLHALLEYFRSLK